LLTLLLLLELLLLLILSSLHGRKRLHARIELVLRHQEACILEKSRLEHWILIAHVLPVGLL
jgi:hypothetical protein